MILFRFAGGLGNQMFQYALFTALKEKLGKVKMLGEVSAYFSKSGVEELPIEKAYGVKIPYWKISSVNFPVANKVTHKSISVGMDLISKTGVIKKIKDNNVYKPYVFDLKTNENYLFEGYWADQRYFQCVREKVANIFDPGIPDDEENLSVLEQILSSDSVSVHIRRGDYLTSNTFLNLSESDYYLKALGYVAGEIKHPTYFIFSDDINWCKQKFADLNIRNAIFVDHNSGNQAHWDIYLMSKCKANILANSTFSWWGGWLNNHENKIVICPAKLFTSDQRNHLIAPQFYPSDWIKID